MKLDLENHQEKIHPSAFIAPNVVLIGNVTVGAEASLWFNVVVRGDTEAIVIGAQTNVQDGCILHADPGEPCTLGARVTLGHGAIVHSAIVDDDVLIGIRATVLDGARIGMGSVIAAGTLIPPGTIIPPRSLVMGVPGKIIRPTTEAEETMIRKTAEQYCTSARVYVEHYSCTPSENCSEG
jgi:carbonic anhydrase/acetyltransferase-like protein (isoleucine patch superfamily)